MKLQLIDSGSRKELTIEVEVDEVLEWEWDGTGRFRVHPKVVRAVYHIAEHNEGGASVSAKFTGVTPEMEQK